MPFVNPSFLLAGLALASVPVIIHLLNRRRYHTLDWAAMDFLMRALRKNRRRLQFESWLLLAMRCLLLALLGLALARPVGCQDSAVAGALAQRTGLHVIVIDNSLSMNYQADRPDAATHLDEARRLAGRLIGRMNAGGESVAVITAAAPAEALLARPTFDLTAAAAAVERVQATHRASDLAAALRQAMNVAAADGQTRKTLHLITDGSATAFQTRRAAALAEIGPELAEAYDVIHYDLSIQGAWNHAVTDLRPAEALVRASFSNAFLASVVGFGEARQAAAAWSLNGRQIDSLDTLTPTASPTTLVQGNASIGAGGVHVLGLRLASDDRLRADNTRYDVVDVASELPVLVVEGQRGIGALESSAAFLVRALQPPAAASEVGRETNSYVKVNTISDLELANTVLGDYRAVVLVDVGALQEPAARQLASFVTGGGALMIFAGEQISADNYNGVLLPAGLLPGSLDRRVDLAAGGTGGGVGYDLKPAGQNHPFVSVFENYENPGLRTAQTFTYFRIDPKPDAEVVLRYLPTAAGSASVANTTNRGTNATNGTGEAAAAPALVGEPAIVAHRLGEGMVIFNTTTANAAWSSFPAKPAFLPLVHELLAGAVGGSAGWLNLEAGQSLVLPESVRLTRPPTLADEQGTPMPMQQLPQPDGRMRYASEPIETPGLYTLSTGERSWPVAVNTPSDEADVRPIGEAAVRQALGGIELRTLAGPEAAGEQAEFTQEAGNDFGWIIMLLVLGLAGAECYAAMRFGHFKKNTGGAA
ncbi:MAG: BatA domain-containing protein [Phycisphaerae bacterium]